MNQKSIERILGSYELLSPHVDAMVSGFYARLFSAFPETRALFQQDMAIQRQHLAATLALLARNLAFQDVLDEPLMELGAQHVVMGAHPEHYLAVRDALLASLAETLGNTWTVELEADWRSLLDHVVTVMLRGAAQYALKAVTKS